MYIYICIYICIYIYMYIYIYVYIYIYMYSVNILCKKDGSKWDVGLLSSSGIHWTCCDAEEKYLILHSLLFYD